MYKNNELLQDTLKIAKEYEEHGHSEELLRQCQEQQEWYDMVNRTHKEMVDGWKGRKIA